MRDLMKNLVRVFYLLPLVCAHAQSPSIAIRGATVVDVRDGSLHSEQTVLLAGNRIEAVGPAREVAVSSDVEVVEAAGQYLIPGLWDMHVHSVTAVDATNPAMAAQNWHLPLFLAHGVTGLRNMGDGTVDVTLEQSKLTRRQLAEGSLRGPPRFLTAGPTIDGDPYLGLSRKLVVRTAPDARAAVERLASNGADLIKVYENLSREAYFAIMDEARRRGIPVDGHVPFRVTPEEAADAGQRTAEHPEALAAGCSTARESERQRFADELASYEGPPGGSELLLMMQIRHYRALYDSRDPAVCAVTFKMYRERNVAVAADLLVYHHIVHAEQLFADSARMQFVPEAIRRNWKDFLDSEQLQDFQSMLRPIIQLELENVRLANEAGVMLLAATDVDFPMGVPGLALHEELARLVEAGLSPLEALQAATLNPVRVLGLEESLGTVEPGKLADLVLLDGSPLEDINNTRTIRAVVADGKLYRRSDLDQLLDGMNVDSPHVSPPNFANYLREWHALNESGGLTEKRYEGLPRKHQYSDGRAFLGAVLGNSVWEGPQPWGEIWLDSAGVKADYGGEGRPAGVIEIQDGSPDGLGFLGEWRQSVPPMRGHFTLHYDFTSGAKITFKSADDPRSQSVWRKSQR